MIKCICLLAFILTTVYGNEEKPWHVDYITGQRYLIFDTTTVAQDDVKKECDKHGAILPEPRTQQENEFLNNLTSKMFPLGMNDKEQEGTWVWDSDATPVPVNQIWTEVYHNWQQGEPNNVLSNEHCGLMMNGKWFNKRCEYDPNLRFHDKVLVCQLKDRWIRDPNTGKIYAILTPDDFNVTTSRTLCEQVGGILPEPRDQGENDFLDSLDTEMFHLGMSDVITEGQWVWSSDRALVTWAVWKNRSSLQEPDGEMTQNCALMYRHLHDDKTEEYRKSWGSVECEGMYADRPKNTICEKRDCPKGFILLGSFCYTFIQHQLTWHDAVHNCMSLGAFLAEPSTRQLNNHVKTLFHANGGRDVWLGATDFEHGHWRWEYSGARMGEFSDWHSSSNTRNNQHCLQLWNNGSQWDDVECETPHYSICQTVSSCPTGRFGWRCALSCVNCVVPGECNQGTGVCTSGCKEGYYGEQCLFETSCHYNLTDLIGVHYRGPLSRSKSGRSCLPWQNVAENIKFAADDEPSNYCRNPVWERLGHAKGLGCYTSKSVYEECDIEMCECPPHLYGPGCTEQCHCRDDVDNLNCPMTGMCGSCAPGWRGEKCDQGCPLGTYGDNCSQLCHPNCLHGCQPEHGHCNDALCRDGFQGVHCSQIVQTTTTTVTTTTTTLPTTSTVPTTTTTPISTTAMPTTTATVPTSSTPSPTGLQPSTTHNTTIAETGRVLATNTCVPAVSAPQMSNTNLTHRLLQVEFAGRETLENLVLCAYLSYICNCLTLAGLVAIFCLLYKMRKEKQNGRPDFQMMYSKQTSTERLEELNNKPNP